jgi:hypothetical protein
MVSDKTDFASTKLRKARVFSGGGEANTEIPVGSEINYRLIKVVFLRILNQL